MTIRLPILLLATSLVGIPISAHAQVIHAPEQIVAGDPVPVRIDGLPAGTLVEVVAERGSSPRLRSVAHFYVRRSGTVDLSRDAPASGDYAGRDPAGLFWAMRPITAPAGTRAPTNELDIRISVSVAGRQLASADVSVLPDEPGLLAETLDGFAGSRLYRRATKERLPVAILLGGSEGGDSFAKGMVPFVTRQGYAALVLPYYAPSWVASETLAGLPADFADIPVDRLEQVRDLIASRPGLDARRIVVIGASKGGEFAMLAAAHFPWLRAVVGIVPSDVVWEGWGPSVVDDDTRSSFAWRGAPLSWVPYEGMRAWLASLQRGGTTRLADVHANGRASNPARVPSAAIAVEKFRGPVMVIGGGRDAVWPSAEMVRNIAKRRRASGLKTQVIVFPEAGHNLAGSGWSAMRAFGDDGTAAASAHAQLGFRAQLARFLRIVR